MSDATVLAVMDAVATQLDAVLSSSYGELQVEPRMVVSPTPPALDVYPGDPFREATTFDDGNEMLFTVRARVSVADSEAGQDVLLTLMDRNGTSVVGALQSDRTLGDVVDDLAVEGPSGYIAYPSPDPNGGSWLGCEWRVRVVV